MFRKFILNRAAQTAVGKVAGKYAGKYVGPDQVLDVKLGWTLLRDRRVPLSKKALGVFLGAGATAALLAAEVPLGALLALLLPGAGLGLDALMDVAEIAVGPALFASLLMPYIAPKNVVQQVRMEQYGKPIPVDVTPKPSVSGR